MRKKSQKYGIWLFVAIGLLLFTAPVQAVDITSVPFVIDQPGSYRLMAYAYDYDGTYAIKITASDVILDGNDVLLQGVNGAGTCGVLVSAEPSFQNVSIHHIELEKFETGISCRNLTSGRFEDNTIKKTQSGLVLAKCSACAVLGNTLNENGVGLFLEDSHDNTITGNHANSNSDTGISLLLSGSNDLTGNEAIKNRFGIKLVKSNMNTISRNRANENTHIRNDEWNGGTASAFGIYLENSNKNDLIENEACDGYAYSIRYMGGLSWREGLAYSYGIYLANSNHNTVQGNRITGNLGSCTSTLLGCCNAYGYGIYVTSSNDNAISQNRIADNSANGCSRHAVGIHLDSAVYTDILNNYLKNEQNAEIGASNSETTWYIDKTSGITIVNGPYLGGNYWAHPDGTGFSQTCSDTGCDWLCDDDYCIDADNCDREPLLFRGDLNANGGIDWGDVVKCAYVYWNLDTISFCADFNGNGILDWADVVKLAYYYWGMIPAL